MNIFTVAFFGHRRFDHTVEVEKRLEGQIRRLLQEQEYVEFLVGRNGDFDQLAASTVLRMRRTYRDDNSALICVLPYMTADYRNSRDGYERYYTEIELSPGGAQAHPKRAIQVRNREMVDRADLILCCIERKNGGAYQTIQYAIRQGKPIYNLAEEGSSL